MLIKHDIPEGATTASICLGRDPRTSTSGDIAVVVRDDYRRQGVGSAFVSQLVEIAQVVGIIIVGGDMLAENHGTRGLIRRLVWWL